MKTPGRHSLGCLTAIALLVGACSPGQGAKVVSDGWRPGGARGLDLVIVTLDTVRPDHLGAYGHSPSETPVIDGLAAEGRLYTEAFSPVPLTLPAHCSLFTGRIPPNHGVRHNGQFRLAARATTLAERFRDDGYDTAAFVSAFVLDRRYGLDQGFEHYDDAVAHGGGGEEAERSAEAVTDAALSWLHSRRESAESSPMFLWVHYYDPHADYRPPEPYASRFAEAPYDGEIAYVDSQLGRLVASLESESTLLIVVGDHGESLGEHGEATHSRSVYDATQRIPLIVWSKPSIRPETSTRLVSLTDLFPTLSDLFGFASSGIELDGESLLAPARSDRWLYFETLATYLDSGWAPLSALRSARDKYILAPRPEYYDLERDPGELTNLYEQSSRAVGPLAELRKELARRMASFASIEEVVSTIETPDSEAMKRLNSLGYLGGAGPGLDSESLIDPKDGLAVQQRLFEAERLRRQDRLDEALAAVEEVRTMVPGDLQSLQLLGILNAQLGRSVEAETNFRDYLARKDNPNVAVLLFTLLDGSGRTTEASSLMERARRNHPDHGGLLIALGDSHAEAGRFSQALEAYQTAKRIDPVRSGAIASQRIVEIRRSGSER